VITLLTPVTSPAFLRTPPASEAIVSWNGGGDAYTLDVRAHFSDGTTSTWLPYASAAGGERRSFSARDERLHIEVDVITSSKPFRAIEVRFAGAIELLALATREHARHPLTSDGRAAIELDVPKRSQYLSERPEKQSWCSPTSLSMVLTYHAVPEILIEEVAAHIHDSAYGGTGNWTFNVAFAGEVGLRGVVVYLRDFAHARAFIDAGLPLIVSYRWSGSELPGAPLEHSAGHLAVLRGFDERGDPILNDPAHPDVRVVYPRAALEMLWLRGGGVAYALAPRERTSELIALANA